MGFEASATAMSENYSVQEVIGLQRNCVATCLRRRCDAIYRDRSLRANISHSASDKMSNQ